MVVLDTTVVIKWFVTEPGSKTALTYMRRHAEGKERIIAPFLLHYEIFNVLTIAKGVSIQQVRRIFGILQVLGIGLVVPSSNQTFLAAQLVKEKDISFYDASYIALAAETRCHLVTADQKLVRKVQLPFVRILAE